MKKNKTFLTLLTCLMATASLLIFNPALTHAEEDSPSGEHGEGPEEHGERGEHKGAPEKDGSGKEGPGKAMFAEADADKDGFLSKAEMKAQQEKRFNEMFTASDTNKDGKLSPEEMKKGREIMRKKFKERMQEMRGKQGGMEDKRGDWKAKRDAAPSGSSE